MDRLGTVFDHFTLSARVFFSGRLCGISSDHDTNSAGHLHVLRSGSIAVAQPGLEGIVVCEPSVLFFPRPLQHRFESNSEGAEIVCAYIDFGAGILQTLLHSLPSMMQIPLRLSPELGRGADLLFEEAFGGLPGRQAAVDRLAEYLLVLILRDALEKEMVKTGILHGLADERLTKALLAMHQQPEESWDLYRMSSAAGMSRARFAAHFRNIVGTTPMNYLAAWRMGIVQSMLRKSVPLKSIAPAVGYESSTALTRAFTQTIKQSPTEWLASNRFQPRA